MTRFATLFALDEFLNAYLLIGCNDPTLPPPDPAVLADLDLTPLTDPLPGQTILVQGFLATLRMRAARRTQHRRACGGLAAGRKTTRFRPREVPQDFYNEEALEALVSLQQWELAEREFALLLRLAEGAMRAYQRRQPCWVERHRAVVLVLLRLWTQVGARLSVPAGGWLMEVCFRFTFRQLWSRCFGPKVPWPDRAIYEAWLAPVEVTPLAELLITPHLLDELMQGLALPEPLRPLLAPERLEQWVEVNGVPLPPACLERLSV